VWIYGIPVDDPAGIPHFDCVGDFPYLFISQHLILAESDMIIIAIELPASRPPPLHQRKLQLALVAPTQSIQAIHAPPSLLVRTSPPTGSSSTTRSLPIASTFRRTAHSVLPPHAPFTPWKPAILVPPFPQHTTSQPSNSSTTIRGSTPGATISTTLSALRFVLTNRGRNMLHQMELLEHLQLLLQRSPYPQLLLRTRQQGAGNITSYSREMTAIW
jgi:hypothetical protein